MLNRAVSGSAHVGFDEFNVFETYSHSLLHCCLNPSRKKLPLSGNVKAF